MSDTESLREKFKKPLHRSAQPGAAPPAVAEAAPKPPPEPVRNLPAVIVNPLEEQPPPSGGLNHLLEVIARMLHRKPEAPVPAAEPPLFTLLLADLFEDTGNQELIHLVQVLSPKKVIGLRPLRKSFAPPPVPADLAAVVHGLRQSAATEKADLVIWGDVTRDGCRLRFTTAAAADEDRVGVFPPSACLELPAGFGEPAQKLLWAAILAALDGAAPPQKAAARRLLAAAAAEAEPFAAKPPVQMAAAQQRSVQTLFGHIAAQTALGLTGPAAMEWFEKSLGSYRAALKRVGRADPAWESGLLHRHIAAILSAKAERNPDPATLSEAVASWRAATEFLPRDRMPHEWAGAQARLGKALLRLDLASGDTDLLRESLQVLQTVLGVYSRTETPQKWAEVMHDTAQVLQVYGDQIRSLDVLRRAVDACDSVLHVWTRDRMPQSWAAVNNTRGTALFLLDKHSEGIEHLDAAADALNGALEVFQGIGATGPASVAARNLARVTGLAAERRGRQIIDPDWVD